MHIDIVKIDTAVLHSSHFVSYSIRSQKTFYQLKNNNYRITRYIVSETNYKGIKMYC